jgi:hypothetical protein
MTAMILGWLKGLVVHATFWVALGAFAMSLWMLWRQGTKAARGMPVRTMTKWLSSPWFLVFVACINALSAGIAIDLCYVDPWDVIQDIVSAQQLLRGRRIYPPSVTDLARVSLRNDPAGVSLGTYSHALKQKEEWEDMFPDRVPASPPKDQLIQAHPPMMTVLFALPVALVGVRGTCLAVNLLSLAALGAVLFFLRLVLAPAMPVRVTLALAALILGWEPVIQVLREGQSGLLLSALLVLGWWCLRRGSAVWAGVAIGTATCLKLFPGLLLIYLFLRHRRALWAASLTILTLVGSSLLMLQWQDYLDYFQTAQTVVARFSPVRDNVSLLGFLSHNLELKSSPGLAMALLSVPAVLLVGASGWLVSRGAGEHSAVEEALDLEYSLYLVLMPLFSPVAWSHYIPILLLPMAVLGNRILQQPTAWPPMWGFFGLLAALSLPTNAHVWRFALPGHSRISVSVFAVITWAIAGLWILLMKRYHESYIRPRINGQAVLRRPPREFA